MNKPAPGTPGTPNLGLASVNDVALAYRDTLGDGRPLVLVHGFTGSRGDFGEVYPRLREVTRCVFYDQRGHGASQRSDDTSRYRVDQLVSDLGGVLAWLGIKECDLFGHSLGGVVALRYALQHPQRVASLVLSNCSAEPVELRERISLPRKLARQLGVGRFLREIGLREVDPADALASDVRGEGEVRARYLDQMRRNLAAFDERARDPLLEDLAQPSGTSARLGSLACPTTIIVGGHDVRFLQPCRDLAAGIPGSELVVIDDAAHSPQAECPQAWLEAVEGHLARARGGAEDAEAEAGD